ncbi:hypothetical protein [Nocardioides sp. Soil796]|uniref:hypothetical protein n=1 Tax=Nocardioides sp. Soil796 TaxID=1736412 RepID=UPI00070D6C3A|nr:hypothetical protein [Nocardioides sp. Soil796]KRF14171.1 hypothetical protein ASH02_07380 [Nocardioides sp. Soil796]
MDIYELHYPGSFVAEMDDEAAFALNSLLGLMESGVAEAAVSLHLFEEAHKNGTPPPPSPDDVWDDEFERQGAATRETAAELLDQLPTGLTHAERRAAERRAWIDAAQELKRQGWRNGVWPDGYLRTVPFLYAKAFLYAVDGVVQALATMARQPWAPESIDAIATEWESAFPTVRPVRNTSQHQDERILGKRNRNKPIELQPIDNGIIHAPDGGITVINSLNGNRFVCTMADGHMGEVEISSATLKAIGDLTQRTISAFTWEGPERYIP